MSTAKKYMITSALPYANGALHLGHLAGAYLPADIYVRYLRLLGKDVVWVCGSDEHGAAITIRAKKEGVEPKEIIDKYHELNQSTFEKLGISFDYYHRTSSDLHKETAQEFFKKLYDNGDEFDEKTIEQYYDESYDQFLADRYITGTCPKCGHPEAYGDQCENCGSDLSPTELIDPVSTLSGKKPVLRPTKHWYFKLDKHEGWLRDWIDNGVLDGKLHHDPKTWKNHVVGQCRSWLDHGLQPRSITRDLTWGIPVPLEGAEGKVLYVWFDAPIGYISSTRQWAIENGKNWEEYWKGEDVELIHFIGKDNIVFHCIVFPAMLKAYGDFALPKNVPANQFLNFEGRKFSKSKGWGIEQHEYLETFKDFPNKEDALRYTLLRNMPENRDSDFKWDDFIEFYDKELADKLGNFINRVISLTNNYYRGIIPESTLDLNAAYEPLRKLVKELTDHLDTFSFKAASGAFIELASYGNIFFQENEPWKLWKEDPESQEVKNAMFFSLQIMGLLAVLSEPFIPFTAPRIRKLLGQENLKKGDLTTLLQQLTAGEPFLQTGFQIGKPEILFPKINDRKDSSRLELVEAQKEKLARILEAEKAEEREPIKPETTFDIFSKTDLRTGTIITATRVPKADKLLNLTIDLGNEKRTILSGIAEFFKPEEVIGQQVIVVANLAPRTMKGIVSEGMILMAENKEGKLGFVNAEKGFGNGFVVR